MKTIFVIVAGVLTMLFVTLAAGAAGAVAALSFGLIVWFLAMRARSARADANTLKTVACEAVNVPVSSKFAHAERGTAIVLNSQTRRVAVSARGESKIYSYDDVRAWDVRKVSRAGGAVGYGLTGTIGAGSQNIAASMEADRQTGLFLTMRDIEHPEWRISMFGQDDRARWGEILRQELDDGTLQAAAR
jgi:hypothetical protein